MVRGVLCFSEEPIGDGFVASESVTGSLRTPCLPETLADLEHVALGVSEVAPKASSLRAAFDVRDRLHVPTDQLFARRLDVFDGVPGLVSSLVVLRLVSPLKQLEEVRPSHIELDPPLTGVEFAEPQDVAIEAALDIEVVDDDAKPVRPPEIERFHGAPPFH